MSTEAQRMHQDYKDALANIGGVGDIPGDVKAKRERLREIGAKLDKAIVIAGHRKLFKRD